MKRIEGIDFAEYLEFCGTQESQSMRQLSDAVDEIWDRMSKPKTEHGHAMPWEKSAHNVRLRPCELSIWAGVNGHGKSLILSQISTCLMHQAPICVASFEMPIASLGERLVTQIAGTRSMSVDRFGEILALTDGKYWVYDEVDTVEPDRVLGMAIYAAKELQCGHIVIDSLVKCGLNMAQNTITQQQKDFVDRLCWIAKTYKTHIHLVHHMRKGESEDRPTSKFDVKGAGEITDLADNVFIVWRNKPKEKALEEDPNSLEWGSSPDCYLTVDKQRHGEWEGRIKLWFNNESKRFRESSSIDSEMFL